MREFLQVGGSPAWLQGLHCAPQKLRNLNEINKLLAHRPWLVTKEHIEVRADAAGTDPPLNTQADPRGHLLCAQPPGFNPFRAEGGTGMGGVTCPWWVCG